MKRSVLTTTLFVGSVLLAGCGQRLLDFIDDHNDAGVADMHVVTDMTLDLSASGDLSGLPSDGGVPDMHSLPDLALECTVLHLPGAPSQVDANPEAYYNPTGALTVEAWVYPTAETTEMVVAGHTGAAGSAGYYLSITSSGTLRFTISTNGSTLTTVESDGTIPLNAWTHVAGQLDANGSRRRLVAVFINGVQDSTTVVNQNPVDPVMVPLGIGSFTSATTSSTSASDLQSFVGWMHDVRISSVARLAYDNTTTPPIRLESDASTLALYHFDDSPLSSNAIDSSSHANPGHLLGGAAFGLPPLCPADSPPKTSGLGPDSGPTAGGTSVVITGNNFTGATAVSFGTTAATSFSVDSSTQITAVSPAGAAGVVAVTVSTPHGTSNSSSFTYVAPPTITSVSPTSGSTAGGTTVTITGTNLGATTSVTFGGTAGTNLMVSDTKVTVSAPGGTSGSATVVVTTPYGTASTTFTYATPSMPTLTSFSPTSGTTAGGTPVTLTGTHLTGTTGVTFDGVAATSVTVVSDTTVTATSPAHSAGDVEVLVTTPGGSATSTGGFTYAAPSPCGAGTTGASLTSAINSNYFTGTGFDSVLGYTLFNSPVIVCSSTAGCAGPWTGPTTASDANMGSQETAMQLVGADPTPLIAGVCYSLCSTDSSKCTNGVIARAGN